MRTITELMGEEGRAWLARLPSLLAWCAGRWGLTLEPPFPLSYNYVAPARQADGREVVLKLSPYDTFYLEIEALRHYAGQGSAALLGADVARGALLMERLRPGTPLLAVEDDQRATEIAAGVMAQLARPLPVGHPFPSVARWAEGLGGLRARFDGSSGPLPAGLVEQAEDLFAELLPSMGESVLLHADLHQWNILSASRAPWLALDPKGMAGERAYEVGAWLRNPLPALLHHPDPVRLLARRVDIFTEHLGLERARIIGWGIAQAVLSAWWSIEDHGRGWEGSIACARWLRAVR